MTDSCGCGLVAGGCEVFTVHVCVPVDQLLTQTLRDLGYGEGLDYDAQQTKRRWYA